MKLEDDVIGTQLYAFIQENHSDLHEILVIDEEKDDEGDPFISFQLIHPESGRAVQFCSVEDQVYLKFSEYDRYFDLFPKPELAFMSIVEVIRGIVSGESVALVWLVEGLPPQAELIPVGDESFFEFLYADAHQVYVEGWSQDDDLKIR